MSNFLSTLRILLGRPTKQDLWNAYYTAKSKRNYKRMRYYFNEIVKINKRVDITKIVGTIPDDEVIKHEAFTYPDNFLDQYAVVMEVLNPCLKRIVFQVPSEFKFDYGMNLDNLYNKYIDITIERFRYYTVITAYQKTN